MMKDSQQIIFIVAISIIIPALVGYLFFARGVIPETGEWVYLLPHINALINSASAFILLAGRYQIKKGNKNIHKRLMLTAFTLGIIFLINYVIYHATVPSTPFGGTGVISYVYYFLLITHILVAIAVVPFVLLALYSALRANFVRHKKIVKYAFPLWLYVAITGVLVYLLISPYY